MKNSMLLFLHSRLFALLRKVAHQPITVAQLRQALSEICPMTNEQVISFIAVCARAEKDGANLIKPRYHFFVRALEGAYITLGFSEAPVFTSEALVYKRKQQNRCRGIRGRCLHRLWKNSYCRQRRRRSFTPISAEGAGRPFRLLLP